MNFLLRALRNWRTTAMGFGSLMTGVGDIVAQIGEGHIRSDQLGPDVAAIFLGLGLLFARDSAVSEHEHKEERQAREEVAQQVEDTRAEVAEKVEIASVVTQAKVQKQIEELHAK